MLGTPTDDDMSYVTDQKAIGYLKSFVPIDRIEFAKKYPGASPEGVDLINRMLQFNPYFRITIEDALNHPFFTKVKKPHKEILSDVKISLEFETEHLDREKLRELFCGIILEYKERRAAKK